MPETTLVDPHTGNLRLPTGLVVHPWVWKEHLVGAFESAGLDPSDASVGHAPFEGAELWWEFQFPHGRLRQARLWTLLKAPDDWSEAAYRDGKLLHDHVLIEALGEPHMRRERKRGLFRRTTLQELEWKFPWGTVVSGYECRNYTPQIQIEWA